MEIFRSSRFKQFRGFMRLFIIFASVIAINASKSKVYYRAAVFENAPAIDNYNGSDHDILQLNVNRYVKAAEVASKENADIIVYPEWGLYPEFNADRTWLKTVSEDIPDPKKLVNPCKETEKFKDRPILLKLSCAAKENNIFLVVNLADYKPCLNIYTGSANASNSKNICPEDNFYLYNTNIVFNRDGTLVAKYYKRHLFNEPSMNQPENTEDVFFDTDFGKFTTFICFDLIFGEPIKALEKSGVYNIAYTTFGFDHFPQLLFATPAQQAWAIENKVNLLAANAHNIESGTLGSGIYSASRGALIYTNNPDSKSRLLISNIQKSDVKKLTRIFKLDTKVYIIDDKSVSEEKVQEKWVFKNNDCLTDPSDNPKDYHCLSLNTTNYKFIQLKKPRDTIKSCANNMCCTLSYRTKELKEDYFFGIYAPKFFPYGIWELGTEGCFLVRCDSLNSNECKHFVLKSNTVFTHADIKGNFSAKYVYPYVVESDIHLTNVKQWSFLKNSRIIYTNPLRKSSLLFLSLWGRRYEEDRTL